MGKGDLFSRDHSSTILSKTTRAVKPGRGHRGCEKGRQRGGKGVEKGRKNRGLARDGWIRKQAGRKNCEGAQGIRDAGRSHGQDRDLWHILHRAASDIHQYSPRQARFRLHSNLTTPPMRPATASVAVSFIQPAPGWLYARGAGLHRLHTDALLDKCRGPRGRKSTNYNNRPALRCKLSTSIW
jgi:hypothetical protein